MPSRPFLVMHLILILRPFMTYVRGWIQSWDAMLYHSSPGLDSQENIEKAARKDACPQSLVTGKLPLLCPGHDSVTDCFLSCNSSVSPLKRQPERIFLGFLRLSAYRNQSYVTSKNNQKGIAQDLPKSMFALD